MWRQTLNIIISSILVLFSIASALSQAGAHSQCVLILLYVLMNVNSVNMTTTDGR